MGQAKQRGTFEQRKAAAIVREQVKREARAMANRNIEALLTPEQCLRRNQARAMTILGLANSISLPKRTGVE